METKQITIEMAEKAHRDNLRNFETSNADANSYAQATLKALLLLNGGAAISMLGFTASISANDSGNQIDLQKVVDVLQYYSFGAACSVLATGLAYVVMYLQAVHAHSYAWVWEHPYLKPSKHSNKILWGANTVQAIAVFIAILSLVFFMIATWKTGNIVLLVVDSS